MKAKHLAIITVFTTIASFQLLAQPWPAVQATLTGSSSAFSGNTHSWADVDGDGDPDLYIDSGVLWINDVNQSGTFINMGNLLPSLGGANVWSAAFGDYNNDGKPDLHLALGFQGANPILENRWPAPFTDIANDYGYVDSEWCQPAFWGDYNNDGLLDLYITHEIPGEAHEFWQNDYPGDFIPRFPQAGGQPDTFGLADLNSHAYGLTWGDIDIDGDLDVVTSACGTGSTIPNEDPHNKVYENLTIKMNGTAEDRYLDRTLSIGVTSGPEISGGSDDYWATLFDYDGDAFPDLFIGDNDGSHRLWRNTGVNPGDFGFELVSPAVHNLAGGGAFGHAAVAGDYDNDGDLDLFITTSGLFRNNGDGSFTQQALVPSSGSFHDASFADYDLDGQLDLLTQTALYHNPGNTNHWVAIELIGDPAQGTTRSAHHVKIRVSAGGKTQYREHRYQVASYSQHMLPTHFGLGASTMIDEIQITWSNGQTEVLTNVPADQYLTIGQTVDCSGKLEVEKNNFNFCLGDTIALSLSSSSANSIIWHVVSGPSLSDDQFNSTTGSDVMFTPQMSGEFVLEAGLLGCPDVLVNFSLSDSDFNGNGNYDLGDIAIALPNWSTNTQLSTFDRNGDKAHNVLDLVQNCVLLTVK